MLKIITNNDEETKNLAGQLVEELNIQKGAVIGLVGELGAGKTTLTQGLAKALDVKDKILSPSFIIIREHQIPRLKKIFYHIDLYRLETDEQFNQIDICNYLKNIDKNIVLIEWINKLNIPLPGDLILINIKKLSINKREILITRGTNK